HELWICEWGIEPAQHRTIPSEINSTALSTLPLNDQHLDCIQKMLSNRQLARPKASDVVNAFPAAPCCHVKIEPLRRTQLASPMPKDEFPKTRSNNENSHLNLGYNLAPKFGKGYKAESSAPLYEPLAPDRYEIRLLRLLPSNGDILSCILEVA